jgi:hypothetical protein
MNVMYFNKLEVINLPHFSVGEYVVFLTEQRLREIKNDLMKDDAVFYKALTSIHNSGPNNDIFDRVEKYLNHMYNRSPKKFYEDFVKFDFIDDEARKNALTVLESYCMLHGYAKFSEINSYNHPDEYILRDIINTNEPARFFCITHFVKPSKWWWKYKYKMTGRDIKVVLDIEKIRGIRGDLNSLTVKTETTIIEFSKDEIKLLL